MSKVLHTPPVRQSCVPGTCLARPVTWQDSSWLQLGTLTSVGESSSVRPPSGAPFLSWDLLPAVWPHVPSSARWWIRWSWAGLLQRAHWGARPGTGSGAALQCVKYQPNQRSEHKMSESCVGFRQVYDIYRFFGQNGRIKSNFKQ